MTRKLHSLIPCTVLIMTLAGLVTQLVPALVDYVHYTRMAISIPFSIDYGEGPLLDQTSRLASFKNIYHNDLSKPPYTISNYPPLFVLIQVPFYWIFGPAYWYGRVINITAMLLTAFFLCLTLRILTKNWLAAGAGGLLLIAVPYVQYWSILNRVDELTLAFSWAALYVTVHRVGQAGLAEPAPILKEAQGVLRSGHFWLASILLVAAIYSRQTYALTGGAALGWVSH